MSIKGIRTEEGDRVVLDAPGSQPGIILVILLVIGVPSGLFGLLALISGAEPKYSWMFFGMGLTFVSAFPVLRRWTTYLPKKYVFDNKAGVFEVTGASGGVVRYPYGEIKGFSKYEDPEHWLVYLTMKNGAVWSMGGPGLRSTSLLDGFLEELRNGVRLSEAKIPGQDLPAWISKKSYSGGVLYSWKDKSDWTMSIWSAFLAAGVMACFAGWLLRPDVAPIVPCSVFLLFLVSTVIYVITGKTRTRILFVGIDRIVIGSARNAREMETGSWKAIREIPRSEINDVSYSYDLVLGQSFVQSVLFMTHEASDYFRKFHEGDFAITDIVAFAQTQSRLNALRIFGRPVTEIAALSRDIRTVSKGEI